LLLDCVHQYGFGRTDFHPQHLIYNRLQLLTEPENKSDLAEKVSFDILLTDAMITLINNLHFGKLNPHFSKLEIDMGLSKELNATSWLICSMSGKDFMNKIISVQPDSKIYRDLQDLMRLMTGQYVGDAYVVPAGRIKTVAINMERLRWLRSIKGNHIIINVPSNSLYYHTVAGVSLYTLDLKRPLPLVTMLETSLLGLWTGMQIGFGDNKINPSKDLFLGFISNFTNLKPTPGLPTTISVTNGGRLAADLLSLDHSSNKYQKISASLKCSTFKRFMLKRAVPINFIYITCEMKDGIYVYYPDTYHLDKGLEDALFQNNIFTQ